MGRELNHRTDGTVRRIIGRSLTDCQKAEEALRSANENLRLQAEQLWTLNNALQLQRTELETSNENLRAQEQELRRQAEALRESEERYRTLFEAAPDGIVVHRDGRFLAANEAALRLTGAGRFEDLGHHTVSDFLRPQEREQAAEQIRSALTGCRAPMREATLLRLDGRKVAVEYHAASVDFQGAPAVQTIMRDITERKKAEETLRDAHENLRAQAEQLRTLTAMLQARQEQLQAAHADLRAQQQELQSQTETLREWNATLESRVAQRTVELEQRARQLQELMLELSQAQERERRRVAVTLHEDLQQQIAGAKFYLDSLSHQARSASSQQAAAEISRLLRTAIGMSRNLSHELSPAIFYGNDLAEAVRWLAEHMEADQGLTVRVDAGDEATLEWESLAIFLFRATSELLSSVVRHAGVHEARVRLRRMGHSVGLRVSDRGRGFDPQECKDTAGFGLLGIRERVELLGGRVKIASAKGRGTKVRIVVPDARPDRGTSA